MQDFPINCANPINRIFPNSLLLILRRIKGKALAVLIPPKIICLQDGTISRYFELS